MKMKEKRGRRRRGGTKNKKRFLESRKRKIEKEQMSGDMWKLR